ncbi:MAG: ATP-binding protein, partial [Bdellovibrionales bacterium]|nr:ATP-binding protein [Bdellovibrionales bacterium]
ELITVEEFPKQFPESFKYFPYSDSGREKGKHFLDQRTRARNQQHLSETAQRRGGGKEDFDIERRQLEVSRVTEEADNYLFTLSDIDPTQIRECVDVMSLQATPNLQVVRKATNLLKDTASLIAHSTEQDTCSEDLVSLVKSFVSLRNALLDTIHRLPQSTRIKTDASQVREGLANVLSDIFPGLEGQSASIISKLAAYENPELSKLNPFLAASRVHKESLRGGHEERFAIQDPRNAPLTSCVIDGLLFHLDEEHVVSLSKSMRQTTLSSTVQLCEKLKIMIDQGEVGALARSLDERVSGFLDSDYANDTEVQALVSILASLARNDIGRDLKGRLRSRKQIVDLVSKIVPKENKESELAKSLEADRQQINRAFSSTLTDYWGQLELKKDLKRMLDHNLKMIQSPDLWRGLPPKVVFFNGILLHGDPGVGKTFMVECLANEYGLEVGYISVEDMQAAVQMEAKKGKPPTERATSKGQDFEEQVHAYLAKKVDAAKASMSKSGALSYIICIDEMESEFRKRDSELSPREELDQTNRMLRVIEKVIEANPEILFVGATNYLGLVDKAARRPGRFGIKLEVRLPDEQDIHAILEGSLLLLGYEYSSLKHSDKFEELLKACEAMTPLAIQNGITTALLGHNLSKVSPDIDQLVAACVEGITFYKRITGEPSEQRGEPGSGSLTT